MLRINRHFVWTVFLILVVIINLMNVNVVLADDTTPPPPPTEEPTQPPMESTETPVVETPAPTEIPGTENPAPTDAPVTTEATPATEEQAPALDEVVVSDLLTQVPENTDVVVLDEYGNPVPLASQEALDIILDTDPMWCPAGVLPGGVGCTINFGSIPLLISNIVSSTNTYDENGIIYFTATAGGSLTLTTSTLTGGDFNTLKIYNLTLQGGWNGSNGGAATFTGQTNFSNNSITIGTSASPWVGNITLNNFTFSGTSSTNAVTVYTTTGNITLDNIDVVNQSGTDYTGFLQSNSGNIVVQNGSSFDGNNSGSNQNRGFSAQTASGAITISNTTFTDANGCGTLFGFCILPTLINYNGATLGAPTVTLNTVTANNNDLNGILINNANLVTLNNINASNNGTDLIFSPDTGDVGSGIAINGTGSTIVNVTGGAFNNNERYGIEVLNGTLNGVPSIISCTGNDLGCVIDNTPPVLTLPANITVEAINAAGNVVTYATAAMDNVDGARAVICIPPSGSTFPITTTTVTCSASDTRGNTANGSFTIRVQDTTPPSISPMANITVTNHNELGANVTFSAPTTLDLIDGAGIATCNPPSGSLFPSGNTTVTCTATDSHGNTSSIAFNVHVNLAQPTARSLFGFAGFIPVTGGELIDLDCLTVANAFGVMVTFHNLCDEQAVIEKITSESLPKPLPSGYSFVAGLDVQVLDEGQIFDFLPENGGVQMDYPLPSEGGYTVLYWNNGQWVEITQLMNDSDLNKMLSTDAENELYKMSSSSNNLFRVLTTDLTGTFVLVTR